MSFANVRVCCLWAYVDVGEIGEVVKAFLAVGSVKWRCGLWRYGLRRPMTVVYVLFLCVFYIVWIWDTSRYYFSKPRPTVSFHVFLGMHIFMYWLGGLCVLVFWHLRLM